MNKAHKNLLLVEGENDKHVIWSLLEHFHVGESFEVDACGTIDKAISKFKLYLNQEAARIEKIAVVLDADENLEGRWQSIQDIIGRSGHYETPIDLPANGLVLDSIDGNAPRIGVWIMPNNTLPGMLEDFVTLLADEEDVLMCEAEKELKHLEQQGINKYRPVHRAKAKIHTFLAWQDGPGKPMGLAITSHLLNPDAPLAKRFVDWVNRVFNN